MKIGIANSAPRKLYYDRLKDHGRRGWEVVGKWEFDLTQTAFEVEQGFLAWVRLELGLPQFLGPEEMPQGGATETFSSTGLSVEDCEEIVARSTRTVTEA